MKIRWWSSFYPYRCLAFSRKSKIDNMALQKGSEMVVVPNFWGDGKHLYENELGIGFCQEQVNEYRSSIGVEEPYDLCKYIELIMNVFWFNIAIYNLDEGKIYAISVEQRVFALAYTRFETFEVIDPDDAFEYEKIICRFTDARDLFQKAVLDNGKRLVDGLERVLVFHT